MSLDLTQYDDAWANAQPAPDTALEKLPDGTYQMVVERIEATATRNDRPCLLWTLRVVGPRLAGRRHWHRDYLDRAETFSYLKKNFALFGIRVDKLSEAPPHFPAMAGKTIEVCLRTTGQFQATYINRLVASSAGNAVGAAPGGATHGDPGIAGLSGF